MMVMFHALKRSRDEDEDDEFAQLHLEKKSRSSSHDLFESRPLFSRTISLPQSQLPNTHSHSLDSYPTPVSESGDHSYFRDVRWTVNDQPHEDMDMDSEDDEDTPMTPPPPSRPPRQDASTFARPTRPAMLDAQKLADPTASTGRVPTPINNTFLRPVVSRSRTTPAPLAFNASGHWKRHLTLDDHGLPSPISENEPTTPNATAELLLSRMNVFGEEQANTPHPARRRQRSGAISQPKSRFVMGSRDDCDKCQARTPGHIGHFVTA